MQPLLRATPSRLSSSSCRLAASAGAGAVAPRLATIASAAVAIGALRASPRSASSLASASTTTVATTASATASSFSSFSLSSTYRFNTRAVAVRSSSVAAAAVTRSYSSVVAAATISKADVEARVLQVLKAFDKIDAAKVTLDAHFYNDLGLDSLDQVELAVAIEEEFETELADRDLDEILTARIGAEKIFAKLNSL